MRGKGFLLSYVIIMIAGVAVWFWLMRQGLPLRDPHFERFYVSRSLIFAFMLVGGVFTALGAILNWNWIYENDEPQWQWRARYLGRFGSRIFDFALGVVLVFIGYLGSRSLMVTALLEKAGQ